MAQHSKYWSCSELANKIRGTIKPPYAEIKDWKTWNIEAKKSHPIRYWIAEDGLDLLQDIIYWPHTKLHELRYYINNRWVSKSNALTAHPSDIKPGAWQDVGWRFLPCLFNELVDFVEIEQAAMFVIWDEEAKKKYNTPRWQKWYRQWRCPEAGLAYLDWAASLTYSDEISISRPELYGTPTPQANAAMEVKELYLWWTQTYKNRPDPYVASGWDDLCNRVPHDDLLYIFNQENETEEDKLERHLIHEKLRDIEARYEKEDEEMLIRLIKIRHSLWT